MNEIFSVSVATCLSSGLGNLVALVIDRGYYQSLLPQVGLITSRLASTTPWREKLTRQQEAKIVAIPPRMQPRFGKGKMVIPKPLEVDALIRRVPKGKVATVFQLREELAKRSKVDVACPSVHGNFCANLR